MALLRSLSAYLKKHRNLEYNRWTVLNILNTLLSFLDFFVFSCMLPFT
jgi:hypothetical protein